MNFVIEGCVKKWGVKKFRNIINVLIFDFLVKLVKEKLVKNLARKLHFNGLYFIKTKLFI